MRSLSPAEARRKNLITTLNALDTARTQIAEEVHRFDKAEGANEKACSFCNRSHTHAEVTFVLHAEGSDAGASICDLCIDIAEDKLTAARFDAMNARKVAA